MESTTTRKSITVRGYEVCSLSANDFFRSLSLLDETAAGIINHLVNGDENILGYIHSGSAGVAMLFIKAAQEAYPGILAWISEASKIPADVLGEDAEIGITGVVEVLAAVLEVNRIPDFFATALPAVKNVWQGIKSGAAGSAMESTKA